MYKKNSLGVSLLAKRSTLSSLLFSFLEWEHPGEFMLSDYDYWRNEETQPLPVVRGFDWQAESREERFRRLKAIADATGTRYLFVYLQDQKRRWQGYGIRRYPDAPMTNGGLR